MKLTSQLSPNMDNVVGTDVKLGDIIVGKIIAYDKENGMATYQIDKQEDFDKIFEMCNGISSKGNTDKINWDIMGDNRIRMKFIIPLETDKKWWQFWKYNISKHISKYNHKL
jgi:hypothetical protein